MKQITKLEPSETTIEHDEGVGVKTVDILYTPPFKRKDKANYNTGEMDGAVKKTYYVGKNMDEAAGS